jgi:phosphoserine phosphatase RsbU/P
MERPEAIAADADDVLHERYRCLLRAARGLFTLTTIEELVENILCHSLDMMQAEACSMYLPDPKTQELIIYSARGHKDCDFHTARIPWDKGIAGLVFQTGEIVRIDDARNDPRIFRNVTSKTGFVTRAMLTIPLNDKGKCIGVLQAINPTRSQAFSDLDYEIFEGLASVVTSALVRLERETRAIAEAHIARELSLAHEIQRAFLPPPDIRTNRAELHVRYQPARTIGGDFYSSVQLPGERLLAVIGDVSGKGIPAALTTAQITGEINALSGLAQSSLSELVHRLNRGLCGRLAAGRFIATTFLLHDPLASTMDVVCAGQFPPWHWDGEKWEAMKVPPALPLGVFEKYPYESTVFPCRSGDKWLLFSDGINEGRNLAGEDYGFDRLRDSLLPGSPKNVLRNAWESWKQFVNIDNLHDDACLLLMATHDKPKLETLCCPTNCKVVRKFIENWALFAGYNDIERGQIVLATDEAFTNILRHTYKNEESHKVEIDVAIDAGFFHLKLRDFGPPIDREKLKGRELHDVRPGGLGLPLLGIVFPNFEFIDCNPGTELRLSKPLPGTEKVKSD